MKRILLFVLAIFIFVACSKSVDEKSEGETVEDVVETNESTTEFKNEVDTNNSSKGEKGMELNQVEGYREGNIKAKIVTNMGNMEIILFPSIAPKAVENFVTHSKDGYYEGVIFHRVIEDFMIQGGDPDGTGMGGESIWGSNFEDEFNVNYRHFTGALSMANAGPGTNGSQFFIVTAKNNVTEDVLNSMKEMGEENGYPDSVIKAYREIGGTFHLDGKHTVFGQVVKGLDVAENISKVETGPQDKPLEDVIIKKIEIEE